MPVHIVHISLWHQRNLNSGFPILPSLGSQPQNFQNISKQLCPYKHLNVIDVMRILHLLVAGLHLSITLLPVKDFLTCFANM